MKYKGKGEHSVNQLEKIIEKLIEENIKLNSALSEALKEIEFNDLYDLGLYK